MADEKQTEMVTEIETPEAASKVTETETISKAEFDKVAAALKEANKEAASRRKRLEELEAEEAKRAEAAMTETEKATKRAQELEAKLKAYERTEAQRTVAEKVGLPAALATRLQGETPEELEADAKALLETLPKPTKPAPGINATNPANAGNNFGMPGGKSGLSEADLTKWKYGIGDPTPGDGFSITDK